MLRGHALAALATLTLAAVGATVDGAEATLAVSSAAAVTDGASGFTSLSGAYSVAIAEISGRTYAVVPSGNDGIQIIDMTNPFLLVPAAAVTDDTDGFTALGWVEEVAIAQISGRTYAVATTGNDGIYGIQIMDITEPAAAIRNAGWFAAMYEASDVAIAQISGRTYAVISGGGIQVVNITEPAAPTPVAAIDYADWPAALDWGWEVAVTEISGRTYAVISGGGIQVVDITEPAAPILTSVITYDTDVCLHAADLTCQTYPAAHGTAEFGSLVDAREVAIAQISGRTYAVIATFGDGGIQVVDITEPAAPTPAAAIANDAGGFTGRVWAERVATADISGRTYAVAAGSEGIRISDITNPAAPTLAAAITSWSDRFGTHYGAHDVAVTEISGRTYMVIISNDHVVQVVDITDPYAPAPSRPHSGPHTTTPVPPVAVVGVGGLPKPDGASDVAVTEISGRTYMVIPGFNTQIVDITEPAAPTPVAAIADDTGGFTALGNAHEVAVAQISGRTYAVIAAFGDDGIQIVDITEPAAPTPAAAIRDGEGGFTELDRPTEVAVAQISGRTYAVIATFMDSDIQIVNITEPTAPTPAAAIADDTGGFTELDGTMGVATCWPPPCGTPGWAFTALGGTMGVATADISGRTHAVTAHNNGIRIFDIAEPAAPVLVAAIADGASGFRTLFGINDIATVQISNRTYMVITAGWDDNIQIVNITDPTTPVLVAAIADDVGGFASLYEAERLAITEISGRTYAVATTGNDGIQFIDITDPYAPAPVAAIAEDDDGFSSLDDAPNVDIIEISGRTYAALAYGGGVEMVDIRPAGPGILVAADAGPDMFLSGGATAVLAGSAAGEATTYEWSQDPMTPEIIFDDRTSPVSAITAPQVASDTTVTLTLTVTGGSVNSTDSMTLTLTKGAQAPARDDPPLPGTAPDPVPPSGTIHTTYRDGSILVAIGLDTHNTLRDFAVTVSCGEGTVDITGIGVDVDGWNADLTSFASFGLAFVDGSGDAAPGIQIDFDADGSLADTTYPISFAGADLLVSGAVPAADAISIDIHYEAAGVCRVAD